jgi:TolA-binding protein
MARRKKKQEKQEEETLVDVVGRAETLQDYVEQNAQKILTVIGVIVLLVAAGLAYYTMVKAPKEDKANELIKYAQFQFDKEAYAIALDGDTTNTDRGFLDIIDAYGGTAAGNLSNYYAGICYLNLGNYEVAIDYLNNFSVKGKVLGSHKYASLGDAYSELEQMDKALSNYKKASTTAPNDFSTPLHLMKLALFQENQGKTDEAKKAYAQIKDKYPNSTQATDAKKYLARLGE